MSCTEDEDKVIQTDLSEEAAQLFEVTTSWSESLYFAFTPYSEYLSTDSLALPGKPAVSIDTALNEVRLTFHPDSAASQVGKFKRTGNLSIRFLNAGEDNELIYLTYSDYNFEGSTLIGSREFKKSDSISYVESFDGLKLTTSNKLTSLFSGEFSHSQRFLSDSLIAISSTGQATGINPAGRDFTILITKQHEIIKYCANQNQILPAYGEENWMISRGESSSVNYKMDYEAFDSCRVEAHATLPDGKRLLLNP